MLRRIRWQGRSKTAAFRRERYGFVSAALLVGLGYTYGGFVPRWWLFLPPLLAAGAGTAFFLAAKRSPSLDPGDRFKTGVRAAAGWLVLVPVPFVVRWVWLAFVVWMMPAPPGAGAYGNSMVNPVVNYGGRSYYYSVMSDRPPDEIYEFYVRRLAWQGWRPAPLRSAFTGIPGHLRIHAFERGFEVMHLSLYPDFDGRGRTHVVVTGENPPVSPWLRDLIQPWQVRPKAPRPPAPKAAGLDRRTGTRGSAPHTTHSFAAAVRLASGSLAGMNSWAKKPSKPVSAMALAIGG
jgi:hypothetical protein